MYYPIPRTLPITCLAAVALMATLALTGTAWAGGGPENVLLVVNPRSPASLAIANYYVQLREIPASNVLYLPWDPKSAQTDVGTFRQRILGPLLASLAARKLFDQIDAIVYSSDFPWGVQLGDDVAKFTKQLQESHAGGDAHKEPAAWPKILTPVGSLTGLTFLWEPVLGGFPGYMQLTSNAYFHADAAASRAFRGSDRFGRHGELQRGTGRRYLLSMMLGVTTDHGNTVDEIRDYLRRSAAADGTHPRGTIYFVQNGDVRSRARQAGFPGAVRELKQLGVAAEVLEGTLPEGKDDVQGLMIGAASFQWKPSQSTILPGAICEHFTSFGGMMSGDSGQTPLSEFLRNGAAAASGTVTEPYAVPQKFPAPVLQVHYARGCTASEAFYQSVAGPYQLLIVGDPLCRPWADIPQVRVAGLPADGVCRGVLRLKPDAVYAPAANGNRAAAAHFVLFCDGRQAMEAKPGEPLTLDTAVLADGYHELRVVAVGPGPIASQGRLIREIRTANHGLAIEAARTDSDADRPGHPVLLSVKAPGCVGIRVFQGTRAVAAAATPQAQLTIDPALLGTGPVQLRVVGLGKHGAQDSVAAKPLEFTVTVPPTVE